MPSKIIDFESKRQDHREKQREARVDTLRKAFRQARGESGPESDNSTRKQRSKLKKK